MPSKFTCCVKNCKGTGKKFRFLPSNKEKWCEILKIDPSQVDNKYRVCELHFDPSVKGAKRLLSGAMPTQRLGYNCEPINLDAAYKSTEELQVEIIIGYEQPPFIQQQPVQHVILEPHQEHMQDVIQEPFLHQMESQREEELREKQRLQRGENLFELEERRRQEHINDLQLQLEIIHIAQDRSRVSLREEQRRQKLLNDQKVKLQRDLNKLLEENMVVYDPVYEE